MRRHTTAAIASGRARLSLLDCRKAEQKTCERRPRSIVRRCLSSKPISKLIVASVLEEPPHRPNKFAEAAAELETVPALLPTQSIACFQNRIPRMHRRGDIRVTHARVTLHVEPWRTVGALTAKADSGNSELRNNVV